MTNKKIMYGLKLKATNQLLQYQTQSMGDSDFSVDIMYELTKCGDADWLVNDEKTALYVMFNDTPRYNADYETPVNKYSYEELELTKVEIITNEQPIELKVVKVELKQEYYDSYIPYRLSDSNIIMQKETRYMSDKIITAIDMGEEIRIVYAEDFWIDPILAYVDKKYFNIL